MQTKLYVKKSGLPEAGKGLFTRNFIKKGTYIIEYTGYIITWKRVLEIEKHTGVYNQYLYYVNRNHVIDATKCPDALARYINDARGLSKKTGVINNCKFTEKGKEVFIEALKDILPGEEILISYGKEYWDIIKNIL
jgi:SET domain-containing protein